MGKNTGRHPDPPCYTVNVPLGDGSDKTRAQCLKLGVSTSGCSMQDDSVGWTGSMCAASPHSQVPFVEDPVSDDDSGIRVFAATQLTSGSDWIPSGCMCYEVEFYSKEDY